MDDTVTAGRVRRNVTALLVVVALIPLAALVYARDGVVTSVTDLLRADPAPVAQSATADAFGFRFGPSDAIVRRDVAQTPPGSVVVAVDVAVEPIAPTDGGAMCSATTLTTIDGTRTWVASYLDLPDAAAWENSTVCVSGASAFRLRPTFIVPDDVDGPFVLVVDGLPVTADTFRLVVGG